MKKFLLIISAIIVSLGINSCNSCQRESEQTNVTEGFTTVATLAEPEILISLDRERMYAEYGGDYRWYETSVVLKDYLDEENDGTVSGVSNIFQVVREMGSGADVFVIMYTHVGDSTDTQIAHSFWIEDFPLNSEEEEQGPALLTFRQAYEKLMETNIPKPHSRQAVLRKEVGPLDANPQWIFGNQEAHVYVDAKTGEVRSWNPVFPQNQQLGYAFTW